ncbi:MAG: SDR family oxidoreductase [Terrimonas sp.]|nr:SDR family oxidoreductase [Terrimonas sp.]OJY91724.1 MAG: short-chain dehydrogenase [Sphingobacteriales bacterium 40-81]
MRLKDKIIIITGSCTGIGKAIAIRAVAEGAKVVVHGLEKEWGEEVVNELGSNNAVLLIEDITNEGAARRLVELAIKSFGKLDAIVNNAAIVTSSNLHTTDAALLRRVIEVNTIAPFNLIKAALPHLKAQKGNVLNIGSVNAYSGEPNLFAYSISKGALMTLTHNLGDTLFREEGVRVNQINPGWVLTENETIRKKQHGLAEDWYKDLPPVYAPARRILRPAEIAAAAMYFLSDESGPVSGQVLTIEQYPSNSRNPPKDTTTIH